jgi:SAM-dependent methyltransferase
VQDHYRLLTCTRCGTQFLRPEGPAPTDDGGYWEPYKFDVYAAEDVRAGFAARYDRMLADATAAIGPIESVLDVGCGIGNFLEYARDRGIRAIGTDVEADAVSTARANGLDAHVTGELDAAVPDGSVDAITLWDVIEHLPEPLAVVRDVVRKLRPGGALLFETPDAAFPVRTAVRALHAATGGRANLTGPLYYWEHKVYFTAAGLTALLDRAGADTVSVRRETTVREKLAAQFEHDAQRGWRLHRVLARTWPALETAARRAGRGNKLMLVARMR